MGTPFSGRAREIHAVKSLYAMSRDSDYARSHTWWRRLFHDGAWGGAEMLCPPDIHNIKGIAKLFEVTPEVVCRMIAEEWYGVGTGLVPERALALVRDLEALDDVECELIAYAVRKLGERECHEAE